MYILLVEIFEHYSIVRSTVSLLIVERNDRFFSTKTPIYEFFRVIRIENTVEDNKSGASKIVLYQM